MKRKGQSLFAAFWICLQCALFLTLSVTGVNAQSTTITTTGYTGTTTGSSSPCTIITFTIKNNNTYDIELTDVGYSPGSTSATALWYSATSITGTANVVAPVWTQLANVPTPSTVANTVINSNFFTGLSLIIPAGLTYRFAVVVTPSTIRMASGGTSPFAGGGVELVSGPSCWGGCNSASSCATYYFFGSITFRPAAFPCTGVPTTSITGPSEICPGKPFDLRLMPSYLDATYTWEKSGNGITWTPFTGAVTQYGILTDAITTPTWYRLTIKCNATGLTFTTPPYFVDISKFYYCYCDNAASPPGSSENKVNIGRVKISTMPGNTQLLNNITITGSQVNNTAAKENYSDFKKTLPPLKMYRDSSFILELSQFNRGTTLTPSTVLAFLDYDRNGIFDDYERIHFSNSFNYGVPGEIRDTFKISDTAHIGLTGMRIIIKNGNTVPDSCGNYANGETEDYLVDIRYQPCTGPVDAGIVEASDTTMCPDYMYTITDTTYERRLSDMDKIWQFSSDNIVWNTVPGSGPKDSLMRIFHRNQPFYYRVRMACKPTKDTSYSNVILVNNKPGHKCYCYSQSDGGIGVDTSDLGGFKIVGFDMNQGGSHLGNPQAYYSRRDFTDMPPVVLTVDSTYVINIYHTMPTNHHGDAKVTLFMDFNNNHKYDIPQERVYTGFTSTSSFVLTPTIRISNNAIVAMETGMRLIINNDISPNAASDSACGTYASGETEDYMVYFRRDFPVNINKTDGIRNLQVHPNPTTGRFHIEFQHGGTAKDIHISVSNVTGQKLLSRSYTATGNSFSEDLSLEGVAPGVYFVELNADGRKEVTRLTVK